MKYFLFAVLFAVSAHATGQNFWAKEYKTITSFQLQGQTLTLKKKLNFENFRVNPDGWKFYKTTLALDIQKNGKTRTITLDSAIFTCGEYDTTMLPCLLIDTTANILSIFANSKAGDLQYGMDGFIYRTDLKLSSFAREIVFTNVNAGWCSFFGGSDNGNPELWHFSPAGYFVVYSRKTEWGNWEHTRVAQIDNAEIIKEQYKTHKNILFTDKSKVDWIRLETPKQMNSM